MSLTKFYTGIINIFNKNNVDYMLVGGHAVNYHGYVRATLDIALWVDTKESNLSKLYLSFKDLGYSEDSCVNAINHLKSDHMIKIPREGFVIDILDSFMMKQNFEVSYKNYENLEIDGVSIKVIGLEDLISNKYKSNRKKDLLDVKELKAIKEIRKKAENGITNDLNQDKTKKNKKRGRSI